MPHIEIQLRNFITENFFIDPSEIKGDTSLVDSGIIDSTGVMEVILFLEERFGLVLPAQDAVPANLDTINNLTSYITSRTMQKVA